VTFSSLFFLATETPRNSPRCGISKRPSLKGLTGFFSPISTHFLFCFSVLFLFGLVFFFLSVSRSLKMLSFYSVVTSFVILFPPLLCYTIKSSPPLCPPLFPSLGYWSPISDGTFSLPHFQSPPHYLTILFFFFPVRFPEFPGLCSHYG